MRIVVHVLITQEMHRKRCAQPRFDMLAPVSGPLDELLRQPRDGRPLASWILHAVDGVVDVPAAMVSERDGDGARIAHHVDRATCCGCGKYRFAGRRYTIGVVRFTVDWPLRFR